MAGISFFPVAGLGEVTCGADLANLLCLGLADAGLIPGPGDILVVAHKVVSKAEGRVVDLSSVTPSPRAFALAEAVGKEPALVQLILEESEEVYPYPDRGILMGRHRLGWVCANAGVDRSNAPLGQAILLPRDPDGSARRIGERLAELTGASIPVLISDTHGRPLREGITGVAVGCWGLEAVKSYVGKPDRFGIQLSVSKEAVADELCAAASLCMGQGGESIPAVLVRGYACIPGEGSAPLRRDPDRELFRPNCSQPEPGLVPRPDGGLPR